MRDAAWAVGPPLEKKLNNFNLKFVVWWSCFSVYLHNFEISSKVFGRRPVSIKPVTGRLFENPDGPGENRPGGNAAPVFMFVVLPLRFSASRLIWSLVSPLPNSSPSYSRFHIAHLKQSASCIPVFLCSFHLHDGYFNYCTRKSCMPQDMPYATTVSSRGDVSQQTCFFSYSSRP